MSMRIGYGYDSHEFKAGVPLVIGGVKLEHTHGLAGHSDGDVLLHAITDALLGAVAAGDIGSFFPPSDPQWKGANSVVFVEEAHAPDRDGGLSRGQRRYDHDPGRAQDRSARGEAARPGGRTAERGVRPASASRPRLPKAPEAKTRRLRTRWCCWSRSRWSRCCEEAAVAVSVDDHEVGKLIDGSGNGRH